MLNKTKLTNLPILRSCLIKYFLRLGFHISNPPLKCGTSIRSDLTTASQLPPNQPPFGFSFKTGLVERLEQYTELGRHSIFEQFDLDTFDIPSLTSELTTILAIQSILALSNLSNHVNIMLGNMLAVIGLCEVCGVLRCNDKLLALMIVLDKTLTTITCNFHSLATKDHCDVSGASTPCPHISFPAMVASSLPQITPPNNNLNTLNATYLAVFGSCFGECGTKELLWLRLIQRSFNINVLFHPLLSRGSSYYNGITMEVISNVTCMTKHNRFVKVGSLFGGGRYDNFTKAPSRYSVGCSLGLSRTIDYTSTLRHPFVLCLNNRALIVLNHFITPNNYLLHLYSTLISNNIPLNIIVNTNNLLPKELYHHYNIVLIKVNGG